MAIKMNQSLKQSQTLTMTPQLQQAIKLLTLTHLEMTNVIAEEMMENPLLEETGGEQTKEELEANKRDDVSSEKTADDFSGPELVEGEKEKFDWDKYVEDYNSTSSTPNVKEGISKDDAPNYENMVSKGETLFEHLEWQLRMESLQDREMAFAIDIIRSVNDEGYLEVSFEDLLADHDLERDEAFEILELVQRLDPVGCATHDMKECLLVQIKNLEEHSKIAEKIVQYYLDLLEVRDYQTIAKKLRVEVEAIMDAEMIIKSLNPKPGRLISAEETHYVVPDIFVTNVGDELHVKINNEGVPRLQVSKLYQSILKQAKAGHGSEKTHEYIQDKLRAATWLIKSIQNRQNTIQKVANAIVKYQPDFFKKGTAYLRPMILKDIANEIEMHESTVSRVTTNKYMHTPLGTFELKFFFNAGIGGKNGGIDIAGESLKLKIKELVENEDPRRPLSDQKISDLLSSEDIKVARRTVAKYREILNIASSSKRKRKKA